MHKHAEHDKLNSNPSTHSLKLGFHELCKQNDSTTMHHVMPQVSAPGTLEMTKTAATLALGTNAGMTMIVHTCQL
jgi:hypothetical protein